MVAVSSMKRWLISVFLPVLLVSGAQAQAYKCVVGGKTVFSDAPCSGGGQSSKIAGDSGGVTEGPVGAGKQLCSTQWVNRQPWTDPEGVRVQGVSGGALVPISFMGRPMGARAFQVFVNAKNRYGGYDGVREFSCYTSEDGQRLLSPDAS
jgi:hypothetical protein